MTCCSLAFGAMLTSQSLLPGTFFDKIRALVERVRRPRVEDRGQHHLVLQRGPGWRGDGFQRLQRVGHYAGAYDNMKWMSHCVFLNFQT